MNRRRYLLFSGMTAAALSGCLRLDQDGEDSEASEAGDNTEDTEIDADSEESQEPKVPEENEESEEVEDPGPEGETEDEPAEADQPVLEDVTLETRDVSDGTQLRLTIIADSLVPVNWLSQRLMGPNGSIRGGGSTRNFTEIEDDRWRYVETFTISENEPSGEYYYEHVSVRNEARLESEPWPEELRTTIEHDADPDKPILRDVTLETADVSDGTELRLTIIAESKVPVNWLSQRLVGPNGTIRGGGSTRDFAEIEDNRWRYVETFTISENEPGGEYYYERVNVRNEARLESDPWPEELRATIDHDSDAEKPVLEDVSLETADVSDGTELQLTIIAESNVPVNWLTQRLVGPNGTIRGGGSTRDFTEVDSNRWRYVETFTVSENEPSGEYYYERVSVQNEARLESDPWPGELRTTIEH